MSEALTKDQIDKWLARHRGWSADGSEIRKQFQFDDFSGSIAFVDEVAELAEAVDHHPDITITYNKVLITLTTHDEGGVTQLDLDLAAQIDETTLGSR